METKLRSYLKELFELKVSKNSKYSLRSYANQLDINPATLLQILNGQRPITKKRADHFIQKIDISEDKLRELTYLSDIEKVGIEFKAQSIDYFAVISDWFYDAILEITHLKDFKPNIRWVATKLKINYNQAKLAVERLKRLKLLKCTPCGIWTDESKHNLMAFDSQFSNPALKRYQKQILEKSLQSIDEVERGNRDHTSFLLSMDEKILLEVHQKIKRFQKEIVNYIEENSEEKNLVQVIHFGSFPITNISQDKK